MLKRFAFVLILPLLLASCNFNTKLRYLETQCADPWAHDQNESLHKENIKGYLLMKGIETGEIKIEHTPQNGMVCEACDCPSDHTIYITVTSEDKAKALALGFAEY